MDIWGQAEGEISSSSRNAPMPPRVELCTGDCSTMLFKSFLELHDCLHAKYPHIHLVRLKNTSVSHYHAREHVGRRRRDWIVSPRYPDLLRSNAEVDALEAILKSVGLLGDFGISILKYIFQVLCQNPVVKHSDSDRRGLRRRTPLAAKSDEASVKFPLGH